MKRIISMILAASMLVSLCACTAKPEDTTPVVTESDVVQIERLPDVFSELRPVEDFAAIGENVVKDAGFDSTELLWTPYEESGGSAELRVSGGEFLIDIADGGKVSHAVQVYYDGVKLHQYAKYTFSFDARCTIPDKKIEARLQVNGGDYHAYAMMQPALGETTQHYEIDFTMEEKTDISPRLCFNLGPALDGSDEGRDMTNYKVYLDNISVICTDNSKVEFEAEDVTKNININQLGYAPDAVKTAVFRGDAVIDKFDVVDEDGNVVYTGEITGPVKNYTAYEYNWYGDFSAVTEPGTYKIVAQEFGDSYFFEIGEDVYKNAFADIVKMFYMQRCGCELTSEYAGDFAHAACHNTPARIYGTNDTLDVSGGWHDAGDYGRYIDPAAKTVADLLMAYGAAPQAFGDDTGIPESGNGISDILDEVRYELEWMLKMQDPKSGGVYHKVTCADFPGNVMPEEETAELILSPISRTATYSFAATMAMAYRYYKDVDDEFAQTCLDAAYNAYEFGQTSTILGFRNPEDITTGEYGDGVFADEHFWASCELLSITGDTETYNPEIQKRLKPAVYAGLGWADMGAYGLYTYMTMDESYMDAEIKEVILHALTGKSDNYVKASAENGYHISLPINGYVWGSNMTVANNAMYMLMANDFAANEDYVHYAKEHVNYLFGVNPVSYSFITGYGTISPNGTHHRPSIALEKTMPGMLVGGPNMNLEDPFALSTLSTAAPACCYIDNTNAYSLNEITIYWNSPLVYVMARLCDVA